eukprot:scaffold20209_cov182-Amphora_coffeaeformis.AAC.7
MAADSKVNSEETTPLHESKYCYGDLLLPRGTFHVLPRSNRTTGKVLYFSNSRTLEHQGIVLVDLRTNDCRQSRTMLDMLNTL